jgi:hypothetical protein
VSQKPYYAFNRGLVSARALARLDINRLALAASEQTNWIAQKLGPMMLRPGWEHIATEPGVTRNIPFVFSADDKAMIGLHDEAFGVVVDDEPLERPAVTAAISNGDFAVNLAGWTSLGVAATWTAAGAQMVGTGTLVSDLTQSVVVNEIGTEHGIRVVVARGELVLRIATAYLGTDYINLTLGVGEHSIGFTPDLGAFTLVFFNQSTKPAVLESVTIESGTVLLTTPWAEDDLPNVRFAQSGDVLFFADGAHQQRRISRLADRCWSISLYAPEDGPFRVENITDTTLTASAITGDITLTASGAFTNGIFKPTHVGALFRHTSVGQAVTSNFTAQNQFGNRIRVTGTGAARSFSIVITGTFVATVTLQYSIDEATWYDLNTYTTATSTSFTDGLDNQIIYYRLGVKTGAYTSGTAVAGLTYAAGSITGVVRITAYTSPTVVSAEVLSDLGGTTATDVWAEGEWSDYRGWPSAVTLQDGRLYWAGIGKFAGSVTDAFYTFDPDYEGDAGPVLRSIGFGPVDAIRWLLSMDRLIAGTPQAEITCRSSAIDEPLTATNFTPKESSTQGTANIQAIKVDDKALFVQRSGQRLYELAATGSGGNFQPEDLTSLAPEVLSPGVVGFAVQRQPDTRVHCVLSDGTVAILIFDKVENLTCWLKVETTGEVEDVCILPAEVEDTVYYVVKRTINGSEVRYLEKWAMETEARGGAINKMADSFVYAADADNVIEDLGHLEGEEVVIWAGGREHEPQTVVGAQVTLDGTYTHRCAGLGYEARFKSAKLAFLNGKTGEMSLTKKKKIHHLGLVLADTHANGLEYGPSFDTMDPLPQVEQAAEVDEDTVHEMYEEPGIEFPGEWLTDARLCLRATAPRPCTVVAALIEMDTTGK